MRTLFACLSLLLIAGCDDGSSPINGLVSPLQGTVYLETPVAGAQVTLFAESDDGPVHLDEVLTDESGAFSLNTEVERGPFRIIVRPPGRIEELTHFVSSFETYEALTNTRIRITPVTAISAGLAQRFFEDALQSAQDQSMSLSPRAALDTAIQDANALIYTHFFEADHDKTLPMRLSMEGMPDLSTPATLVGMSLDALNELSRLIATRAKVSTDGVVTLSLVTAALADDIRADGVFNGQGVNGPVLVLNQFLDSHTLRRDYALALLRFIESERDLSDFGRPDVRRFADRCANSDAAIFPPDITSPLEADPPIVSVTPKDGAVVRGEVFAQVTAADEHKIDQIMISAAPSDFDWRIADDSDSFQGPPPNGIDPDQTSEETWYRRFSYFGDTTALPDGRYTITAIGIDELDNATREELTWIVDNTAPTVDIETPQDGAILSGEDRTIVVRAIDTNGLASFVVTLPDGLPQVADIPQPRDGVASPTESVLRIDYNSTREVDGRYTISAVAEDVVGNRTQTSIEIEVDNAAPSVIFRSPRDGASVEGLVNIVVEAEDASPIDSFVVTTPDGVEHPTERSADGEWRAQIEWDSTTVFDGPHTITATVTDGQGIQTRQSITVEVDNIEPGIIAGVAHFDSPLSGLVVEAWSLTTDEPRRLDLCAQGREGLCLTDEDGAFELQLVDDYQGPVVLYAIADQNTAVGYIDAATGDEAILIDFDLRTLLIDYQPGQRHQGLVFSAPSTLTTDWLLSSLVAEVDPALQAQVAIHTWGEHFCPGAEEQAPCDPTSTRPQRYDGTDPEFVPESAGALLGLVQAGLSRRAADLRLRHDEQPFWGVGLLRRFRRDFNDGVLNGADGELRIRVDSHPRDHRYIDGCSLRSGLAAGMGSFLNKTELLNVDVNAANASDLRKQHMQAYIEGVSTRIQPGLWAADDICEFDGEGPTIIISQPETGERFGPSGGMDSADWRMRLRAIAEDDSEVAAISINLPNREPAVVTELNPSPGDFIAELDYEALDEGNWRIEVVAVDLAGNRATESITPSIDLTPPSVNTFTTSVLQFDFESQQVHYQLEDRIETSEEDPYITGDELFVLGLASNEAFTVSGAQASNISFQGPWWWAAAIPLNPGLNRIALTVTDVFGNAENKVVWVLRDAEGPTLELVESGHYHPERDLSWREVGCVFGTLCDNIVFDFDAGEDVIEPDDLRVGRNRVAVVISKFYDNWNGEITGRVNQPTVNFDWDDELGDVTFEYRVRVSRQVRIEGACCEGLRFEALEDWREFEVDGPNVALPIRPDTIHADIGLEPHALYRVEARVTNRAGLRATANAMFEVHLTAPPLSIKLTGQRARREGQGIGALTFDDLDILDVCQPDELPIKLSELSVLNPWPYPIRVRANGNTIVEQYERKAWRRSAQARQAENCAGDEGDWRLEGPQLRCQDDASDLPNVITPQYRVHVERHRIGLSGDVQFDDNSLNSIVINGIRWLIIQPNEPANLNVEVRECDLPFQDDGLIGPSMDRRTLMHKISAFAPNGHLFDLYRAVQRVSRLRFSVDDIRVITAPMEPHTKEKNWHGNWTDSHTIDNDPLRLPEGIEGGNQ
jgi:hypothetical protein